MIFESYNINTLLVELETALSIKGEDYNLTDLDQLIKFVRERLSKMYNMNIYSDKVYDAINKSVVNTEGFIFVDNMSRMHSKFSGLSNIIRHKNFQNVSLDKIDYLGNSKESMLTILQMIQSASMTESVKDSIDLMKTQLVTINNSTEKRLFVLLIVTWELGLYELSAVISEILYMGGI